MRSNDYIPTVTPWGWPQTTEVLAPGIILFTTTGHGGIWVSPERNDQVPMSLQRATYCQQGIWGWYKEGLDAAIVYRVFELGG